MMEWRRKSYNEVGKINIDIYGTSAMGIHNGNISPYVRNVVPEARIKGKDK